MEHFDRLEMDNTDFYNEQAVSPLMLNESWAGRRLIEALSHLPNLSGSIDMRFQQRQQQEREQRRIEMTGGVNEDITSVGAGNQRNALTTGTKNIGNGKVRQMFDERRRGAGIDRSNPLKPITTTAASNTMNSRTPTSTGGATSTQKVNNARSNTTRTNGTIGPTVPTTRKPVVATRAQVIKKRDNTLNYEQNGNVEYNEPKQLTNEVNYFTEDVDGGGSMNNHRYNEESTKLSNKFYGDKYNNNSYHDEVSSSSVKQMQNIKLNPVVTKKSPPVLSQRVAGGAVIRNAENSQYVTNSFKPVKMPANNEKDYSSRATTANKLSTPTPKSARSKDSSGSMAGSAVSPQQPPPEGMTTCKFCGRNFNTDRIDKHQQVCQKVVTTKRKVFDVTKQRIKGTEAEEFLRKPPGGKKSNTNAAVTRMTTPGHQASGGKKNNWRQKHEDFIAAIRAAKQVQAHLARGGKLSDLPPPPPSQNPDYVQCPHCMRRFNETAAARHIPKCATMLHNKPKPGMAAANRKR